MNYILWLWHHSHGIRCYAVLRIMAGIGQVALGLLMVWLSRHFIDDTIRMGTTHDVICMTLLLALTVLGGVALRQVGYWLTNIAGIRQTNRLRLHIFSSLFRQRLFTSQDFHSGDVSSRLSKDIDTVSGTTTDTLPQMTVTAIQLCGAFLLMRWFDARLAWALLLLTPLAIVGGKLISRRLRQMTLDIRQAESRIQIQVQEVVEHHAVLRSLGSEEWVTYRLDDMQHNLRSHVLHRARFTVLARFILGCAFSLGYLLAFVWGGIGLRNGTITFGVMTSFLQLVGMIQHPILQLLNMVPSVIHTTASIDRLMELSDHPSPVTHHPTLITQCPSGTIQLDDVTFRYQDGDRDVLSHVTHHFPQGSKTAVMGTTGIGKTTLFRLLLDLVQPTGGTLQVGGTLSFVPQGNTLMSGTIRHNLLLARPEATDDEMRDALHTACADFVYQLPNGLDTVLGERGGRLSEGQAQRIAIARALLRPADIMLLDEISSALDEPTEQQLFQRLFQRFPHTTMLLITHRPNVSTLCDDVVRLT